MGTTEVCKRLGISRATLQRRVEGGEIVPLPKKPGQKRNFPRRYDAEAIGRIYRGDECNDVKPEAL